MKRKILLILSWSAVLFVCAAIFWFSDKGADASNEQSSWIMMLCERIFGTSFTVFFVRKAAHICEFAALGFFSAIAFSYSFKSIRKVPFALAFSVLYAVSDEIHQLYVEGRAGQVRDVLIDTLGILGGIAVVLVLYFIINKWRKRKDVSKPQGH